MKNLLIFALGLAPLAAVASLSTSDLVLGVKPQPDKSQNAEPVSPEETMKLAQRTQSQVTDDRPHVEMLLSAVAQPYQFGTQATLVDPPTDLGDLAKSWQGVREGLTLCDVAARELGVKLPPFTPLRNPPEAQDELKKQIAQHNARFGLVNTRVAALARLKDDLEKSTLEGKEEILALVAKEHLTCEREKEAIDAAIKNLGAAEKMTGEMLDNDAKNKRFQAEAEKLFSGSFFEPALAELGKFVEPSSAAVLQRKGALKAEIDREWLNQIHEQVNKLVAAKEFSKALAKIDEYKGGLTKDAQALKDQVTDQVNKENQQFEASVTAAFQKGDYFGAVDWLLKYHDPKPEKWAVGMSNAMTNAANTLLARAARIKDFQPNPDLKPLRDDLNRFKAKIDQVDIAHRPKAAKDLLSERTRVEGTFETVNLLQSLPPKMTIADWAKSAAEVQRTYPDRQIKTRLAESLAALLKSGMSVSNKPSGSYASAGTALRDDISNKSKWTDFQKALAKETDPKYNIAKKVVADVLAAETWPNVEKVLKAD